ncbi:MAG: hypothetical protein K5876_00750 [Ruminiclostridium sp.]|nr:hypothetical protein [Ruminiclostridium sp.]
MSVFDDYDNYDQKMDLSESTEHIRESNTWDKKKVEGYEPNPHDSKYYEVFGIKNSFDNVSVGADKFGQTLISVNTMKEPGEATLDSDKKKLKGNRRKQKVGPYGDFYTNLFADRHGAFAFRADRNISDIRIIKEFEEMSKKRVSHGQRDAMPMLRIEEDQKELSELRNESGSQNENFGERRRLQRRVRREKEYADRFRWLLRKARRKTYDKKDEEEEEELDKDEDIIIPKVITPDDSSDDIIPGGPGADDIIYGPDGYGDDDDEIRSASAEVGMRGVRGLSELDEYEEYPEDELPDEFGDDFSEEDILFGGDDPGAFGEPGGVADPGGIAGTGGVGGVAGHRGLGARTGFNGRRNRTTDKGIDLGTLGTVGAMAALGALTGLGDDEEEQKPSKDEKPKGKRKQQEKPAAAEKAEAPAEPEKTADTGKTEPPAEPEKTADTKKTEPPAEPEKPADTKKTEPPAEPGDSDKTGGSDS